MEDGWEYSSRQLTLKKPKMEKSTQVKSTMNATLKQDDDIIKPWHSFSWWTKGIFLGGLQELFDHSKLLSS